MIGRKKELKILNTLCETKKSSMVAVFGRRRIGKTYLVDYMFRTHRKDCLFFKFTGSADQNNDVQLDYFIYAIKKWFGKVHTEPITKWHKAFMLLQEAIDEEIIKRKHTGKIIVFIDEIAWIDRFNKYGFLSALGKFHNDFIEDSDNLITVLCGSNASWIKEKILKDTKGPLFHRVDKEIAMMPFDLKETKEYLLKEKGYDIDDKSVIDIYMTVGGVAKYLSYLDEKKSIPQAINELFFELTSPLYEEYDLIFKSLFYDKDSSHKNIITAISNNGSGVTINELEKLISNVSGVTLRKHIEELVSTGFILPINRFQNKTRLTKYIIIDNYVLFYNKWLKHLSKNDIATMIDHYISLKSSNAYITWGGLAFETTMIANIHLYLKRRGLSAAIKSIGYWDYNSKDNSEEKGTQIDILVEYNNHVYDIVECKYYNKEFVISKEYNQNLENKKAIFIKYGISVKQYELKLIMLTTYGTNHNQYYHNLVSDDINIEELL